MKKRRCIEEGDKYYAEGHEAHFGLLQQETSGEPVQLSPLLVHAEDQLMNAILKITAEEIIALMNGLSIK